MTPFSYHRVDSAAAARAALAAGPHAALLAGGTGLLDLMKQSVEHPATVIDLNFARDLAGISVDPDGTLRIGAMTTLAHATRHPALRAGWPLLAETIVKGLTPQLRDAATFGGNVMQRPRCVYFREAGFACNKRRPESGCAARAGVHHAHAILGGEAAVACIAVHPSDLCTTLTALDAAVEIAGPLGAPHTLPIAALHRLPERDASRETTLAPGALLTAVLIPPQGARFGAYGKAPEAGFALAAAAVLLRLEAGLIAEARIVLGGVAHKPWPSPEAAAALLGRPPDAAALAAAADAALADAETDTQTAYRRVLTRAVLTDALARATDQALAAA